MTMYEVSEAEILAVACAGAKFGDKDAYVFASALRVPCLADDGHDKLGECGMEQYDEWTGMTRIVHHCGGRGWSPPEDFAVWFLEIREAQFWASIYHNEKGTGVTGHVWHKNDPGHYVSKEKDIRWALLKSLHDALTDVGATLFPEAPKIRGWT